MKKDRWNRVVTKRWFIFVSQERNSMKMKALLSKTGCLYCNCYVVDKKEYIFEKKLGGLFASIKKGFTFAIR